MRCYRNLLTSLINIGNIFERQKFAQKRFKKTPRTAYSITAVTHSSVY